MEQYYTSYTKTIDNKTYYFVKKFTRFNELKNAPAVLESYGMHTNFNKACSIASIYDPAIKEQLLKQVMHVTLTVRVKDTVAVPELSKTLRVERVDNRTVLATKLTGIKKIITSKLPSWRLSTNS